MRTFSVVPSFVGDTVFFELPDLGFQGDNKSFAILFNLTELTEHWPDIVPSIIITDPENNTYLAPDTEWSSANHLFTWTITNVETAYDGTVRCQLKCETGSEPNKVVCMSQICQTRVYPSLSSYDDPPEAFQSWLDSLTELAGRVTSIANTIGANVEASYNNAQAAQAAAQEAASTRDGIEEIRDEALAAQTAAETARAGAEAARTGLQAARQAAESARDAAISAKDAAEDILDDVDASARAAAASASSASDSAAQALANMTTSNSAKQDAINAKEAAITARQGAESAQTAAEAAQSAAETANTAAQAAKDTAVSAKDTAVAAKTDAEAAQAAAETAQTGAETAQTAAETAQTAAETANTTAQAARSGAETANTAAQAAMNTAVSANADARIAKTNAEAAQAAAEAAQRAAETAQTTAVAAQADAETAQTAAEAAQSAAETAQAAAETAQADAETAQTAAETAEAGAVSAQTAAEIAQQASEDARDDSHDYADLSKRWAIGQDLNGNDVISTDDEYENFSKYWATIARIAASNATGGNIHLVTVTLQAANWDSNTKRITVAISEVTANNVIIVAPARSSKAAYEASSVEAVAQAAGELTFACEEVPTSNLQVEVFIIGSSANQTAVESALIAEGWAVGTNDGMPVSSTSEFYQNSAKYYSQQAEAQYDKLQMASFAEIDNILNEDGLDNYNNAVTAAIIGTIINSLQTNSKTLPQAVNELVDAIALKASKSEVTTLLTAKANQAYVDSALAQKQDVITMATNSEVDAIFEES